MEMELANHISQVQKITVTQKLIEYLEILQMPGLELGQHIEEMIKTNPLLEWDSPEDYAEMLFQKDTAEDRKSDKAAVSDDYQDEGDFLSCAKAAVTLREYLKHQLFEFKIRPSYIKIASYLIDNIDADGYLREDTRELACVLRVSEKAVNNALKLIQSLEPAGVGARNLKECLRLQLRKRKALCRNANYIIEQFLDQLATKSFMKISRESGLEVKEIERIYTLIKSLSPKPGYAINNGELSTYIIPDILLREIDGSYILLFNDESVNPVRINKEYAKMIREYDENSSLKNYIKKKLAAAVTLVKAVEQRKKSMLDVAGFIIDVQQEFFKAGFDHLKPLTMQMAADRLGVHVSTVSRVVNGKYIQTSRGLFELKFFFSSAVDTGCENKMAGEGVKDIIRKIVQEEDKRKPLSDEQIKEVLKDRGIAVARRTVSKYREMLSILPAAMRKA